MSVIDYLSGCAAVPVANIKLLPTGHKSAVFMEYHEAKHTGGIGMKRVCALLVIISVIGGLFSVNAGHSLAQSSPTPQATTVVIRVFAPTGFPVRAMIPILVIGEQQFTSSGYSSGSLSGLDFILTSEEFAQLADGAPVMVHYGSVQDEAHYFGNLDKNRLENGTLYLEEHLRQHLQVLRDFIEENRGLVWGENRERLDIDGVLSYIEVALKPDWWDDPSRLNPESGLAYFDAVQTATNLLIESGGLGWRYSGYLRFPVWYVVSTLDQISLSVVLFAVEQAAAEGWGSHHQDHIARVLGQATQWAEQDQYQLALQCYRHVWQYVTEQTGPASNG
jgi:hypothetical protein